MTLLGGPLHGTVVAWGGNRAATFPGKRVSPRDQRFPTEWVLAVHSVHLDPPQVLGTARYRLLPSPLHMRRTRYARHLPDR